MIRPGDGSFCELGIGRLSSVVSRGLLHHITQRGNRLSRQTPGESIEYSYDANDRLEWEKVKADGTLVKTTTYSYDGPHAAGATAATGKSVHDDQAAQTPRAEIRPIRFPPLVSRVRNHARQRKEKHRCSELNKLL